MTIKYILTVNSYSLRQYYRESETWSQNSAIHQILETFACIFHMKDCLVFLIVFGRQKWVWIIKAATFDQMCVNWFYFGVISAIENCIDCKWRLNDFLSAQTKFKKKRIPFHCSKLNVYFCLNWPLYSKQKKENK